MVRDRDIFLFACSWTQKLIPFLVFFSGRTCNPGYTLTQTRIPLNIYPFSRLVTYCMGCGAGTYLDAAGGGACKPCTVRANNSYFLARTAGTASITDSCPW